MLVQHLTSAALMDLGNLRKTLWVIFSVISLRDKIRIPWLGTVSFLQCPYGTRSRNERQILLY